MITLLDPIGGVRQHNTPLSHGFKIDDGILNFNKIYTQVLNEQHMNFAYNSDNRLNNEYAYKSYENDSEKNAKALPYEHDDDEQKPEKPKDIDNVVTNDESKQIDSRAETHKKGLEKDQIDLEVLSNIFDKIADEKKQTAENQKTAEKTTEQTFGKNKENNASIDIFTNLSLKKEEADKDSDIQQALSIPENTKADQKIKIAGEDESNEKIRKNADDKDKVIEKSTEKGAKTSDVKESEFSEIDIHTKKAKKLEHDDRKSVKDNENKEPLPDDIKVGRHEHQNGYDKEKAEQIEIEKEKTSQEQKIAEKSDKKQADSKGLINNNQDQNKEEPKHRVIDLRQNSQNSLNSQNSRSGRNSTSRNENQNGSRRVEVQLQGDTNSGVQSKGNGSFDSAFDLSQDSGRESNSSQQWHVMRAEFGNSSTSTAEGRSAQGNPNFSQLVQNFKEQINKHIVKQTGIIIKNDTSGEIKLVLKPENLGRVRIQVSMEDNRIAGRFFVENNNTREIIEQNLQALQRAFKEEGFETASLDVFVGNQSGQKGKDSQSPPVTQAILKTIEDKVPDLMETGVSENLIDLVV